MGLMDVPKESGQNPCRGLSMYARLSRSTEEVLSKEVVQMLFRAPLDTVNWDNIEAFCTELSESTVLDYKLDFPKDLERTICAMANTHGGLILIGIDEDTTTGKAILPIRGINAAEKLRERVTNIAVDGIFPPVIPEVYVCPNSSGDRVVVIVRIAQSHESPHAANKNTNVYVRTGARNNPEEIADLGRVQWLTNQRSHSVSLRGQIQDHAHSHNAVFCPDDGQLPRARLSLFLCPMFPREQYRTPPELNKVFRAIGERDYTHTFESFPPSGNINGRLLADGIGLYDSGFHYAELNCHGGYFYSQLVNRTRDIVGGPNARIRAWELVARLDLFLASAAKFYKEIGYFGPLYFNVELRMSRGCILASLGHPDEGGMYTSVDELVQHEVTTSLGLLGTERRRLVLEPLQRICWAFNYEVTQAGLDQHFLKTKGKGS